MSDSYKKLKALNTTLIQENRELIMAKHDLDKEFKACKIKLKRADRLLNITAMVLVMVSIFFGISVLTLFGGIKVW